MSEQTVVGDRAPVNRKRRGIRAYPEYEVWKGMKQRCHNPNHIGYPKYGARGVAVCDRWSRSYEAFLSDMGRRPSDLHSIDRIENDRGYEPGNCRWATDEEQQRNKSINHRVTAKGETLCVSEWAERTGLHVQTILDRLRNGWDESRAVTFTGDGRAGRKVFRKRVFTPAEKAEIRSLCGTISVREVARRFRVGMPAIRSVRDEQDCAPQEATA